MFKDFFNLLFPITCSHCGQNLASNEDIICAYCLFQLPQTQYWLEAENTVAKKLWGRVRVEHCSSFLHFIKDGMVQHLLHQLKYKNGKEIGQKLGKIYATELKKVDALKSIDYIVPVPLFKGKEKKRGYNQSQMIAEGISDVLLKPVDNSHLIKKQQTSSQTNLNRWNRWQNQQEKFEINDSDFFQNKHILIVDDVITTGATIESCISLLNQIPNCTVSAVFIASAL
jgi:ComF family protein